MIRVNGFVPVLIALNSLTAVAAETILSTTRSPVRTADVARPIESPKSILRGKVRLQGAYLPLVGSVDSVSADQAMRTDLNAQNVIPDSSPYGPDLSQGQQVFLPVVSADFFENHSQIVDWVLVEVRQTDFRDSVLAKRSVFVDSAGTLRDLDGSEGIRFALPTGKYTVVIRHRNHLGRMGRARLTAPSGVAAPADFGQLVAGNAKYDGQVRATGTPTINDYTALLPILGGDPSAVVRGYRNEDLNMNGMVNVTGQANDLNFLLNWVLRGQPLITQQPEI